MIADLAETGALLLLRKPSWKVGDDVRLELYVELDVKRPRNANGRVVRIEPLPEERSSLWTHQVAIDFAERIELSAAEIESLEKRQAPLAKR
jgi:PilZ domain